MAFDNQMYFTETNMILYIKNMVCDRCKMVVADLFKQINIVPIRIDLTEIEISEELTEAQENTLRSSFKKVGFELMDDKRGQIIEKIKTTIIELVQEQPDVLRKINSSLYIAEKVGKEYKYLTTLFSEVEGNTIEHYLIHQKIKKVKELLIYDEHSLSQIADALQYKSVQHLSMQFKKITGLTPSHFKESKKRE
jgi:AraC-like DNA-binding protein